MTRVLVDADALAYTAGFASQSVVYDWCYHKDGEVIDEGITADKSYLPFLEMERPLGVEFSYESRVEAQPLENALAMTKRSLLHIEDTLNREEVEFKRMELFLTGKGNYRERLATIRPYKGNRTAERPVHYAAIRRYMTERWKAETVDGMEADDMLAIIAHQEDYDPDRVLIVSMDKDLMTVPGRLYNFKRKKFYHVTPQQALLNFYKQCLTGDVVDNIGGCYRCGPKRADEILHVTQHEIRMYEAVLEEYEASLTRKDCPYVDLGAEAALLENARLLHMQRRVGEMWVPPTVRGTKPRSEPSSPVLGTRLINLTSTSRKPLEDVLTAEGSALKGLQPTPQTSRSRTASTSKRKATSPAQTESAS